MLEEGKLESNDYVDILNLEDFEKFVAKFEENKEMYKGLLKKIEDTKDLFEQLFETKKTDN